MRAIGAQKSFVLLLVLIETLCLGLTFGSAGTLLGSMIVKVTTGKLEIEAVPFCLRETIDATLQSLRLRAADKGLSLVANIPDSVLDQFIGDPLRLRQILLNLTDNALKFTPAGGVVTLCVERRPHEACVHVEDTGPGVPPEQRPHLFERFFRGDPSRSAEGGTGLGLAITKGIGEAHGGSVTFAPNAPTGSRFTLSLPL